MNRWIRRGAIGAITLIALAAAAVALGLQLGERKMNRKLDIRASAPALRTDAPAVERGRYLFASRGCAECHGANGGGRTFAEDGHGLKLAAPNITSGGATATYSAQDWARTIRHGVKPDGRPVQIMPSEDYNRFTDDDLAAVVAYARQLPPQQGGAAVIALPLPPRVLYGFGAIPDAAEKIDHSLPPAQPVAEGVSIEHGKYVANLCLGCHGPALAGGKIASGPPDWPAAARLAPGEGSVMPRYPSADSLIRLFKTGKRADGSAVAVMPFETLRELSDTDARALHLYLTSLGAAPKS